MNVHTRQTQYDAADSSKLTEDVWRVVALYLQTSELSPLEGLWLEDLLCHWHGALTEKQEKQLLKMYDVIKLKEVDDDDALDDVMVARFLGLLH